MDLSNVKKCVETVFDNREALFSILNNSMDACEKHIDIKNKKDTNEQNLRYRRKEVEEKINELENASQIREDTRRYFNSLFKEMMAEHEYLKEELKRRDLYIDNLTLINESRQNIMNFIFQIKNSIGDSGIGEK